MCGSIKTLHNFEPRATDEEVRAAARQFVRKVSGFAHPSKTNELAFNHAVDRIALVVHELLDTLVTNSSPRNRELEAEKARARGRNRFRAS